MDTDSISAAAVSAGAVTKIQTGIGSSADVSAIKAKTDQLTFDSGNVNAKTNAVGTDAINAAAVASDAVTEIQAGLATSAALSDVSDQVEAVGVAVGEVDNHLSVVGSDVTDIISVLPDGGAKISKFALTDELDTVPVSQIFELVLCMVTGRFKKDYPTTGDLTFYKQDNVTVLKKMHVTETERTRI
jgi:hypothetical protein